VQMVREGLSIIRVITRYIAFCASSKGEYPNF
jgi:hypothetical protein